MPPKSRTALGTNKCLAQTKRCIWLLPGQFPLLLLLSSLQRPTESAEAEVINLASDSFDDQYQGCTQQIMEKLNQEDYFTKEIERNKTYAKAWYNAHLNWLNQAKTLPRSMVSAHAAAILVYSLSNTVRSDFTKAMATGGRSPQQYKDLFHFKYLHYYLTSAVQLLREEGLANNDYPCLKVHHEAKDIYLEASRGATIRFGQFLTISLLNKESPKLENQTQFTISTCLGVPVEYFSLKREVLIPPYELFEVVNVSYHQTGNWLQLQSIGNLSIYNCELLKASSKKYIPAPIVTVSLSLLTTAIISSQTGE